MGDSWFCSREIPGFIQIGEVRRWEIPGFIQGLRT